MVMDSGDNFSAKGFRIKEARDAFLHMSCALLEYRGFEYAWNNGVYMELNEAFESCAKAQLPARFVLSKILKKLDALPQAPRTISESQAFASLIKEDVQDFVKEAAMAGGFG